MDITNYKSTNLYIVNVTKNTGPEVLLELQAFFKETPASQKIKLLGLFEEFEDFESVKNFVQGIQIDNSKIKRLEKYAVVSNKRWFEHVLEFENKLVPKIPFKFFKSGNKEKAIDWLLSVAK
jgi:hypothetical protein